MRVPVSLSSQPCLPIYVSELKLAFSLAMAIQFGSGVFWVRFPLQLLSTGSATINPHAPCPKIVHRPLLVRLDWISVIIVMHNHPEAEVSPVFSSSGGFTGHEHQADGADEEKTGVHGPAPFQQIRPRCLLVTPYSFLSFFLFFFDNAYTSKL